MEIGYVNKNSLLIPTVYRSEVLVNNEKLKLTLDNSRNIIINLKDYPKGIYYVKYITNNGDFHTKQISYIK